MLKNGAGQYFNFQCLTKHIKIFMGPGDQECLN